MHLRVSNPLLCKEGSFGVGVGGADVITILVYNRLMKGVMLFNRTKSKS
jgi:hypothetical protein